MAVSEEDDSASQRDALAEQRAKNFLRTIAKAPFIAIVFDDDGDVQLFTKGISAESARRITTLVEMLQDDEESDGDQDEG